MATDGHDAGNPTAERWSALLQATSSADDGDGLASVALVWERESDVVGYNLYARSGGGRCPSDQRRPSRSGRSRRLRELRRHVPEGSREWMALRSAFTAVALRDDPDAAPVDPGDAIDRGLNEAETAMFDAISSTSLALRLARGTAFVDRRAQAGKQYAYELRGVLKAGNEVVLATDVLVVAGAFVLPDPPSGLTASVGDRKVLVLWNRNPYAANYVVQRATSLGGPFQRRQPRNRWRWTSRATSTTSRSWPRPGFLDYQYWDVNGAPITHTVSGLQVAGPFNGTTYHYRVASRDNLDRRGAWSRSSRQRPSGARRRWRRTRSR